MSNETFLDAQPPELGIVITRSADKMVSAGGAGASKSHFHALNPRPAEDRVRCGAARGVGGGEAVMTSGPGVDAKTAPG